ncbi:hypothetical protein A3K73_09365 [Candidatus Pacearchaeota archaeon RBG_13_36_9]|nr:MAG: hypothetical protein A3K73_09365 [Candidatus Pacearchaeota archaeon RBG_13_36_9]
MPEEKKEENKKGNGKSNGAKKDISYTEYYRIKTGIELSRQQLKKHLEELEQLAKKKGLPLPEEVLKQQAGNTEDKTENSSSKPRKQKTIERAIIALIFILALGAIAYISLASLYPGWLPFGTTGYSIMAGDSKILQISEFYIDDTSVLGDKQTYQAMTIRPITSSKKFNFIFKPARTIEATNGTLQLNLVILNNSNIYLNDELIFPNLNNYELIQETNDGYNIYIIKDILNYTNLDNSGEGNIASEFLYNNFPSSSVWSMSELEAINPIITNYKPTETLINTTFRGDLHFAAYAKDNLNIKMTKQDLNSYLGADEYTVNITNYRGEAIYTGLLQDDGIKEGEQKRGEEQNFEVNKEVEEGVYYIDFIIDKNNQYPDVSVKNIKFNTNKIMILGTNLPIEHFDFYTEADSSKVIGFNYWHTGKNQLITISGTENIIIDLNEGWISKTYGHNLTAGEYDISLEKGDLWVYSDIVSPSKDSWFNLPPRINEKFNNQDFLVIDAYTYDHYNRIFYYEEDVNINGGDKFSFRALEEGAVGIESINLELK